MDRMIELNRLPPAEAEAIFAEVQALDDRIFLYRSRELQDRFYARMRDLSRSEKIVFFYEEGGARVGFNLITIQSIEVGARAVWVVGSKAGFLPVHTGGNRTMLDAIQAMLRFKRRHPDRQFFFVSFLINPGGYDMLIGLCPTTFPSVHRPRAPGIEWDLIAATGRRGGVEILHEEPERIVGTLGCSVREPFPEWRPSENIRFFEELNPRYAEGELLGICVSLDLPTLLAGGLRLLLRRLRKRAPAWLGLA